MEKLRSTLRQFVRDWSSEVRRSSVLVLFAFDVVVAVVVVLRRVIDVYLSLSFSIYL